MKLLLLAYCFVAIYGLPILLIAFYYTWKYMKMWREDRDYWHGKCMELAERGTCLNEKE